MIQDLPAKGSTQDKITTDTHRTSKHILASNYTQNKIPGTLEVKAAPDNKCEWGVGKWVA